MSEVLVILWGYEIPEPDEPEELMDDDALMRIFGDVKAQLDRLTVVK
jgi:hypothetical protein